MQTETETLIAGTVTADILKAIRRCDTLVFGRNKDAESTAWAIKRNPKYNEPFEPYDFRHEFIPGKAGVINYTGSRNSPRVAPTSYTVLVQYGSLALLRHVLKVGDIVSAEWTVGNNNEHVSYADLRSDQCEILITRGQGLKRRQIAVPVGHCVRPQYSTDCHI